MERSADREMTGAKSRSPLESERAIARVASPELITHNDPSASLSQVSFLFVGGSVKRAQRGRGVFRT